MKTVPIALQAHYDGRSRTLAHALVITRADGEVFAFTSHNRRQRIGGIWYEAAQGLDVTNITGSAGLDVGNLELRTLDDGTLFTRAQIVGGLWQGSAFLIFRYNWASVADGIDPLSAGNVGNVQLLDDGAIVVELRDLRQWLQQPVGSHSSKTCRARLGDERCTKDLTAFTHAGTLTSVTSRLVMKASALAQATDYFGEGEIRWVTGANAGLESKVKTHENSGGAVFSLLLPLPTAAQPGDTFIAVAGCRKRHVEDCGTKFGNILNFQGEPHRVPIDQLMATPEASS